MTTLTLYGYWRSSASYRVRCALELKGLAWTHAGVHLVRDGGEQHSDAYRALNPMREVPTLVVEDGSETLVLGQSVAIAEYLEERFPEPALFPKEAARRAKMRQLVEVINSGIHPVGNLRVLQALSQRFGADQAVRDDWAAHWIKRGFDGLEVLLAQEAGTFAFGDEVTWLDCVLVPQCYNARRFGVDLTAYPTIARVEAAARELDAFKRALPEAQPDAP